MPVNFKIEMAKIGPHGSLKHAKSVNNLKNALFAVNGSGKTFISKMFRLCNATEADTNKLLSFGSDFGEFKFSVENNKELRIQVKRNEAFSVVNNTGYLFHTFNSEYVKENIEVSNYAPNGDIEGYIIGKSQIDISNEKKELEELEVEIEDYKLLINDCIKENKARLDKLKINKLLNEYKRINHENIYLGKTFSEDQTFKELIEMLDRLKSVPEEPPIIGEYSINADGSIFKEINEFCMQSYDKGHYHSEFKTKVQDKYAFIKLGVSLLDGHDCPFCEQRLQGFAQELVNQYEKFLEDTEAKGIEKASSLIGNCKNFISSISEAIIRLDEVERNFNDAKKYIPSFKDETLKRINDLDGLKSNVDSLIRKLEDKKKDVGLVFNVDDYTKYICTWLQTVSLIAIDNEKKVNELQGLLSDTANEKKKLHRRICNAVYLEILDLQLGNIHSLKECEEKFASLEEDIKQKQATEKKSKKESVMKSLRTFLDFFFKNKYRLNDNFNLVFLGNEIGVDSNVSDVLSDGEKSIVAFCFYLSEVHLLVNREDDYDKIYFVIDDPISSLDFHYVYCVNQILRNLKKHYPITRNIRYLVLTHSIEFMSLLLRNKVVGKSWILEDGCINSISKQLIMPYESHLRDIYRASLDKDKVKHTIENSIRHVIETIQRFDNPCVELEEYFYKIEEFENNEYLFSLIQDKSHGVIRSEQACTPSMVQGACQLVIQFIANKFSGQKQYLDSKLS